MDLGKKPLTIRCDAEILAKCKVIAKIARRSLNSQIEEFLANNVSCYEKEHGKIIIDVDSLYE